MEEVKSFLDATSKADQNRYHMLVKAFGVRRMVMEKSEIGAGGDTTAPAVFKLKSEIHDRYTKFGFASKEQLFEHLIPQSNKENIDPGKFSVLELLQHEIPVSSMLSVRND